MKTNKEKTLKRLVKVLMGSILSAAILLASGSFMKAEAASDKPFPDLKQVGSISVTLKESGTNAPVPGGKLELFKVADVVSDNGFKFQYTADFNTMTDDISETADLSNKTIADNAAKIAAALTAEPVAVGTDGKAKFAELQLGLYLIYQKDTEAAEGYNPVSPFLVTIPFYQENENGAWDVIYDVDASPKVEAVTKKAEPSLKPCKGDPPVRKVVLRKSAPLGQEFLFEFRRENAAYPMPVNTDGTQVSLSGDVQTLKVTTSGKDADGYPTGVAEAGDITFDKIGDYTYTYREVNDKKYAYVYDDSVYYITYHVKAGTGEYAGSLVVDSVETWIGRVDGTPYKDTPYKPSANDPTFNDPTYASAKVVEFVFYNEPGGRDGGGPDGGNHRPGFDPGTGPQNTPGEVLGESRDPILSDSGVLGADRTPDQAVLGQSRLPQTGQLWWPVPILLIGGIILIGGGFISRKREE